ncbi:MAG: orotidine-5'-phosphate decarboxylase [Patescibacteria group bacterium]
MERNFLQLLKGRWPDSCACVGLDSDYRKLPASLKEKGLSVHDTLLAFNGAIVNRTHDLVCAYKLQSSFYEAEGPEGIAAMVETVKFINDNFPDIAVISDAKRADIGNTNDGYVSATFDRYNFDAMTLHPYLGIGALKPFLSRIEKGCIILCRTSNDEAREFQDLIVQRGETEMPLWQYVAHQVTEEWNTNDNCCMVAGATYPGELAKIREIAGDMPLLIPGIGAQGGDIEATVKAGKNSQGAGMIINNSRGITFASDGPDFAEVARAKTIEFRDAINLYR